MAKRFGIGRGVTARLSGGHLLMLAVGALGAVSTFAAIRSTDDVVSVVVAGIDLQVGDQITADDLAIVEVRADDPLLAHYVSLNGRASLVGLIATSPIQHGTAIHRSSLVDPATSNAQRTMSFSVTRDRAVDGNIIAGDRIDVIAVGAKGSVSYALVDAIVVDSIGGSSDGPISSGPADDVVITVVVESAEALRLAGAIDGAEIRVARSTGAEPIDEVTWFEPATDSHPGDDIDA